MKVLVAALTLLVLVAPAGAQAPACEDRLRETTLLVDHYARSRAREAAEAARTLSDLLKEVERLRAEIETLKQKLPSGQPGGR